MNKKKSAVFALPHLMTKNGILSNDSILRIKLSVEIFIKNNLDYIITSGWDYRKDSKKKLGDVVADYLTKNYRIKNHGCINVYFSILLCKFCKPNFEKYKFHTD